VKASLRLELLEQHQADLRACSRCPSMIGPPVVGAPVLSDIFLIGQAPGDKEPKLGRPFAWTAGKNLFKWFAGLGVDEATFRAHVYMAAVCRCFPGKNPKGGDRVPSDEEIDTCRPHLHRELALVRPKLLLPIGRLAIEQFLPPAPLVDQIGRVHHAQVGGERYPVLPLPHPSGASTWYRTSPGDALTRKALALLGGHEAWARLRERAADAPS
jgi:uracil-DNA glycosylase